MASVQRFTTRRGITVINSLLNRCLSADTNRYYSTNIDGKQKSIADITEFKGKPWVIFASPVDVSLVCAVSADFEMHRGIAREFKKTFGNVNELKEQNKKVGEVAVLKRNETSFVYHLLVKENWWDQGSTDAFHSSLSSMKDHCIDNNISELALPRMGTGDDGIGWDVVKGIINQVFDGTSITIKAYSTR